SSHSSPSSLHCFPTRRSSDLLTILHQCLDTIGIYRSGKSFCFGFYTFNYRKCHVLFGKLCVYLQHFFCFCFGFFLSSMSGMTFLPQKLCGTQKQTGTHFPTNHISPLVH